MNRPLLLSLPGNETLAASLAEGADMESAPVELRRFPDGESYVRLPVSPNARQVALLCTLARPDDKLLPLVFAASAARDLGARRVGLVCPYLAYMRQDRRFKAGEAVTSRDVAELLSGKFDWIITVDPHLHRYASLSAIYRVPYSVLHAAPLISQWIRKNVGDAIIVGPDVESEQWVSAVAAGAGVPFTVLEKTRHGDRDVTITIRDASRLAAHTPVLVDDIISSGRTMLEAVGKFGRLGTAAPVCIGVHGIFADRSDEMLLAAGARVVTCNTISHASNLINVSGLIAPELRSAVGAADVL